PDELLDTHSAASWKAHDYQRPMSMGGFVFNFPAAVSMDEYRELEATLLQLPDVESVYPETIVTTQLVPGNPYFHYQWNLRKTGHYSNTAASEVVGINAVDAWDLVGGG